MKKTQNTLIATDSKESDKTELNKNHNSKDNITESTVENPKKRSNPNSNAVRDGAIRRIKKAKAMKVCAYVNELIKLDYL
jgi:hypothetical protein